MRDESVTMDDLAEVFRGWSQKLQLMSLESENAENIKEYAKITLGEMEKIMKINNEDIINAISNMNILELNELTNLIEKKFNISIENYDLKNKTIAFPRVVIYKNLYVQLNLLCLQSLLKIIIFLYLIIQF